MDEKQINQTFCKIAWAGMTSTMINTFRPCCRFPLDDKNQYPTTQQVLENKEDAFNNIFLTQLRQDMLNNVKRSECSKCYVEEISGIKSLRQKSNELLQTTASNVFFDKLEFLEISLDNLCNLECRMCSSKFSTKLRTRDHVLTRSGLHGFQVSSIQYKTLEIMDSLDLNNLKMVKLLGGEPLISPSLLKFLFKIPKPHNVELLIITNGTTIPSKDVIDKLREFKQVNFDFSVDGIYEYNDYQRVGSNFESIISNIKQLSNVFQGNHSIHSVYSTLNIFGLDKSTDWFRDNLNLRTSIDIVNNNILSPFHSPEWFVNKILSSIKETNPHKIYVENLFRQKHSFNDEKWNQLLRFVKITDNLYDTDISIINPSLSAQIENQDVN
jgi:organic radical activating enzyme